MKNPEKTDRKIEGRAGFSLIEVCLAILVVGLGLLSVFSLFPEGLRMTEEGAADTHCGLFCENMMNGLRGNAAGIANLTDWTTDSVFKKTLIKGVIPPSADAIVGTITTIQYPPASAWATGDDKKAWLRYQLSLDSVSHSATLKVWEGQYGPVASPQVVAYTEFVYKGM